MRDLAGRKLGGRYLLSRQVGVGTTSTVWEATDEVLQRTVAAKVVNESFDADPEFIEQFRQEAMVAARLAVPGIVAIFDTVREPDVDALIMEFVAGMALSDFLRKYAPLPASDTVELGRQVLTALEGAHDAGVIHARLRPETIILCDDRRVKITDTGFLVIAALESGPYEAPEVTAGGRPDPRADVFSVGAVLYECLTGTLPYESTPQQGQTPAPMASAGVTVSPSLESAVGRALSITPEARFGSAAEFAQHLSQVDVSRPAPPTPDAPLPPDVDDDERRKLPALLAAAVAAIVVLLGLALIATSQGRDGVRGLAEGLGLVDTEESADAPAEAATPGAEQPDPAPEDTTTTTIQAGDPITLVMASPFDPPPGSGTEHDNLAVLAIDGDSSTLWHSESYATRAFGGLKDGVGLVVEPEQPTAVSTLDILSGSQGWSLQIYTADQPAGDLAGWGEPVAGANAIAGNAQFDLGGATAGAVLIWITDLGNAPAPLRVDINEVTLHGVDAG